MTTYGEKHKTYYEANKEKIKAKYQTNKEERKAHYAANRDDILKKQLYKRRTELKYIQSHMAQRARRRAKQQGWDIDIDLKYVRSIWPEDNSCPIFKTVFTMGDETIGTNASLDRIDSSKGYVRGNVIVICKRANSLKSDATLQELEAITAFYKALSC